MPLNDPGAYQGAPTPQGISAPPSPMGSVDASISQALASRMQSLTPEEKAMLGSVITPQTAPVIMKILPELASIAPRLSAGLPGQQNTPPGSQSPLTSTPITG